jgi:hypothetical protein
MMAEQPKRAEKALDPPLVECSKLPMAGQSTSEQALLTEALLKSETERVMDVHFVTAQIAWVEGHLGLLCILRSLLGNDLDKVMILAAIGQRLLHSALQPELADDDIEREVVVRDKRRLINIESVANSTGIPRESVRRKVNELAHAGWIERLDDGGLTILPKAVEQLLPATMHTRVFLDRLIARYMWLMVSDGRIDVIPAGGADPR